MKSTLTIAGMTSRSLVRGRRPLLVGLLAVVVLAIALLIRQAAPAPETLSSATDLLALSLVAPLIALLLGVHGLGNEMEDGSITYVLATPVPRWQIALGKLSVIGIAGALTGAVLVAATWLVLGGDAGEVGLWLLAGGISGLVHGTLFTALGAWVKHSVVTGLLYLVLWEQVVMGIATRARFLSLHHASLSLADHLSGSDVGPSRLLQPGAAAALLVAVLLLSGVAALRGLSRARLGRGE